MSPDAAQPVFPPLLSGIRLPEDEDPFEAAIAGARDGDDGGTLYWSARRDVMSAALVLLPEEPLGAALGALLAVEQALTDSLGALTPPETAVEWGWPDQLFLNGARAGCLRAACDTRDLESTPDWLVAAVTVQIAPLDPDLIGAEPGERPDLTALVEEGCTEIGATRLVESWSRHFLVWLNMWQEEGFRPVHEAWRGRSVGREQRIALDCADETLEGLYLGLDETGDLLLKTEDGVRALPFAALLDRPSAWPPKGAPSPRILKEETP